MFSFPSFCSADKSPDHPAVPPSPEVDENPLLIVLDCAKKAYFKKGLSGGLEVENTVGVFTVSGSYQLGENDVQMSHDVPRALKPLQELVETHIDRVIETLIARSKSYRGKPFSEEDELSTAIGISDPILGAFSISIGLSATIANLLKVVEESEKPEAAKGEAAKEEAVAQ